MKLKQYTVLLLYPDYLGYGPETYLTFVRAHSAGHASDMAQREAAINLEGDRVKSEADFMVLLVIRGHHKDCR